MSGLFDSGKPVQAPPVKPTPPVPTVDEQVADTARKKRPRGRQETFLTGDLIPETGKKRTLG